MIQLRIKEVLMQKGKLPTAKSLHKMGMDYRKAKHLLSGKAKSISFEDLELLCVNLFCTPKEILQVQLPQGEISPLHPLLEWATVTIPKPIQQLYTLSPESNKELSEYIEQLHKKDLEKANA